MKELRDNTSLEKLIDFSRESFKAHWKGKDLAAIKSLDRITRELSIPTQSECNLANSLVVYIYYYYSLNI